jgi:tRNA-specific 2-thiouridylase
LPAVGEARYVRNVDAKAGKVTVAPRESLMHAQGIVSAVNWVETAPPASGTTYEVSVRHRHAGGLHPARIEVRPDGTVHVRFSEPVFALTPGQALVAYRGDAVLCGGTIAIVADA